MPVSIEAGNFFFEPLKFHLEAANLLVEFGFTSRLLLLLTRASSREEIGAVLEQRPFPVANLVRMHAKLAGELIHGLLAFDRFERDPKLEVGTMAAALGCHGIALSGQDHTVMLSP